MLLRGRMLSLILQKVANAFYCSETSAPRADSSEEMAVNSDLFELQDVSVVGVVVLFPASAW
jgi:hypothetical protein